ncbi:MAG: AsmA family protein, partial [Terriglobia bacterium]
MSKAARVTLIVVILLVAFVVAVVVVAPRLFDVDRYRPQVISLLEQQTGRPVEIGHLSLSVFPVVSIKVDRLSIGNPPGFPPVNWLSIQQVRALLDSKALWHRQIVIRSLDLEKPVLSLQSDPHGRWNTQFTPAAKLNQPGGDPPESRAEPQAEPETQPQAEPLFSVREITKLTIEHGTLTMTGEAQGGQPAPPGLQITGISGHVDNIALTGLFGQAGESPARPAPGRSSGFLPLPPGASGKLTAD